MTTLHQKLASMGRKRSKYGNKKIVVDGITFDSKLEAKRWGELKLLERAGEIRDLSRQPRYPIEVKGHHIGVYYGDFSYIDGPIRVCEDVKSPPTKTDLWRLKWKLVMALYPLVQFREHS